MMNFYNQFINFKNDNGALTKGQKERAAQVLAAGLGVPVEKILIKEPKVHAVSKA